MKSKNGIFFKCDETGGTKFHMETNRIEDFLKVEYTYM